MIFVAKPFALTTPKMKHSLFILIFLSFLVSSCGCDEDNPGCACTLVYCGPQRLTLSMKLAAPVGVTDTSQLVRVSFYNKADSTLESTHDSIFVGEDFYYQWIDPERDIRNEYIIIEAVDSSFSDTVLSIHHDDPAYILCNKCTPGDSKCSDDVCPDDYQLVIDMNSLELELATSLNQDSIFDYDFGHIRLTVPF